MHDGAVRAGAGDGVEGQVAQQPGLCAEGLQPVGGCQLIHRALRRLARQPGQEARHRRPVAPVRLAAALQLHRVLAGLGQQAGIGGACHFRPCRLQLFQHRNRRCRRIDADPLARRPQRRQCRQESVGRGQRDLVAEVTARCLAQLGRIDEQADAGIGVQDGEGQRQRRVRHVGAANVQQPGDGFRQGQRRRILARLRQVRRDLPALVCRDHAGMGKIVRHGGGGRRRRLVSPDRVQRVALDSDQRALRLLHRHLQLFQIVRRVQPGIVAQLRPRRQIGLDPVGHRLVGAVDAREQPAIDLCRHLQRVAAIDEHRRRLAQHRRSAGRTSKAGQPGQPLGAGRHILALMLVGARHQEPVQPAPRQFGTQGAEAGFVLRAMRLQGRCGGADGGHGRTFGCNYPQKLGPPPAGNKHSCGFPAKHPG